MEGSLNVLRVETMDLEEEDIHGVLEKLKREIRKTKWVLRREA